MRRALALSSWATWTSGGVALRAAPHEARPELPLADWPEAAPLSKIHPRARRPHPSAKQLVQLTHALLAERTRLGGTPLALERTGLILGTQSGCAAADREFFEQCAQRGPAFGSPSTFVYTLPTAPLGEVSIALGLRGGVETISAGADSGLAALEAAAAQVARGALEAVVCGGMELQRTADGKPSYSGLSEHLALFLIEPALTAPAGAHALARGFRALPVTTALDVAAWLAASPG